MVEAFYDGESLKKLNGEKLYYSGEQRKLVTKVHIEAGVQVIGGFAFAGAVRLESIVIPDGVITIGEFAFHECSALTDVVFSAGLVTIGLHAFSHCTALSSAVFREGLTTIGSFAFCECSALSSVVFCQGLTTIGHCAFFRCSVLSSISIPSSMPHIYIYIGEDADTPYGSGVAPNAFLSCSLLSQLSSTKGMVSVEQFLRRRWIVALERYVVLTALLRLCTELYARPQKRQRVAVEWEEEEEEEEVEQEVQHHDGRSSLKGKLAFESITSADVWRYILEFL